MPTTKTYHVELLITIRHTWQVDATSKNNAIDIALNQPTSTEEIINKRINAVVYVDPRKPRQTTEPCPDCGRHDGNGWFTPCPSDDCPSREVYA